MKGHFPERQTWIPFSIAPCSSPVLLACWRSGTCTETILKATWKGLEVAAAACACSLAALGLQTPIVPADLGSRVATVSTRFLLDVQGSTTTARTQTMGLLVALAHTCCAISSAKQSQNKVKC